MSNMSKKRICYFLLLIICGVCINLVIGKTAGALKLPLYLDSIGTMFIAVIGGSCPGMFVGFVTNLIGGVSDSTTFYYGTINVLIALIAGWAAERGYFGKWNKVIRIVPFYLLLSIPCSFLTYVLFQCQVAENLATPVAMKLHNFGLPVLLSQILGDFCIELPDKFISLSAAFFLIKLVPLKVRHELNKVSQKNMVIRNKTENKSSLRTQVAIVLLCAGVAIVLVAFSISYKTYMEARVEHFTDGQYNFHELEVETLLYSGKMLSAVLGLLLCIVSFAMMIANRMIVTPLLKMAKEMRRFAYDSDSGRNKSVAKIESLDIHTGNEIEELYLALSKTTKEIDEYIDMINTQSKTIADLHINIITTLADIVESRDDTTGNHVKRTAEYVEILAKKLCEQGNYTEILTDEYINILKIAAPLHDIGKVKIPDAILNKPGRLTDEEYEVIKRHATEGGIMLDNAEHTMGTTEYLQMAKNIAMYHHEWWNGGKRGYPERRVGEQIPLSARIMAVADVLDALLSKRPYKDAYSLDDAFAIMKEESGTHFDPLIIEAMFSSRDRIEKVMQEDKNGTGIKA